MNELKTKKHVVFSVLLVAIMLLATIPAVSAAPAPSATLVSPADPTNVHPGDVISIQVNNLGAGDHFKYVIKSSDLQTPGNTVSLSGVNMPFAFNVGTSTTILTTTGVTMANNPLTVTYGGTSYNPPVDAPGSTTITNHQNIKAGNYDVTLVALTKTATLTGIDYSVAGDASAPPASSTFSFAVTNVNTGHITVEVYDTTYQALPLLSQTFTILPTPTVEPTSNGGGDGPSGPAVGPQAGPQQAPLGFSPSSVSFQLNDEGKTLADYTIHTDATAGYEGSLHVPLGETLKDKNGNPLPTNTPISITPLDPTGLEGAPLFAFECEPSGTQFTGGEVTFTITMTDAQWAAALVKSGGNLDAMTVGFQNPDGSWTTVPAVVDPVTHTVTAQFTHFSIYALFIKATNEVTSTSPQTFGSLVSPTPASTVSTIVPISTPAKTMQAPPSTTQSPGLPGLAVVGVVGLVGLFIIRKKQ